MKMKKLLVIAMSLVLSVSALTACGSKEQSVTLSATTEADGLSMVDTITLDAEGDKIVKITEVMEMDMSAFSAEEQAMVGEVYDAIVAECLAIEGVECTGALDGAIYTLELIVDTTGDAVSKLADLGLMQITGNSEGGLSFKTTQTALESNGYSVVE